MTVVIHIAGGKRLRDGKVGIKQSFLQFADFIVDIILMRSHSDLFF
jgi:hypothetical protein